MHFLSKRHKKAAKSNDTEHDSRYAEVLEYKERLAFDEHLVVDVGEAVVLDPVVVFGFDTRRLELNEVPFVVLHVAVEHCEFVHERVVQVFDGVTPAAEDYQAQLVVEWKLQKETSELTNKL